MWVLIDCSVGIDALGPVLCPWLGSAAKANPQPVFTLRLCRCLLIDNISAFYYLDKVGRPPGGGVSLAPGINDITRYEALYAALPSLGAQLHVLQKSTVPLKASWEGRL